MSASERTRRRWSPAAISYLFLLVIIAGTTADGISSPALTRIYESIYCRQYYADNDPSMIGRDGDDGVPEEFCKIGHVQGEVAMLKAWQTFFEAIGSILLAIPWGYFADVYGRKPVLMSVTYALLARAIWIQVVCYFWKTLPIKLVWLTGLYSITGGASVFSALAFTIVADVMPQEKRVNMFFRYGACQLFARFLSSPLASFIMPFGLFVATVVGTVLYGLMCFLVSLIPETLDYNTEGSANGDGSTTPPPKRTATLKQRIRRLPGQVRESTAFLWSDIRVLILVLTYLTHSLIGNLDDLLVQYVSARFHIPLARSTLVLAFENALMIVHLLAIMPGITYLLTKRYNMPSQRKDLLLGLWSALFLTAGLFGIGIAPTLPLLITAIPVLVAGVGFAYLTRSLVTSFVEPHHIARLYTVLTLVDMAGLMAGSPAFAALFDRGLEQGGGGVAAGLPFIVCGLVIAISGASMLFIRIGDGPSAGDEEEAEREALLADAADVADAASPEESVAADPVESART